MTAISNLTCNNSTLLKRVFLDPAWCSFAASLLLSAISIYGTEIPNRDGMLYIQTAAIFLEEGLTAARANFDWVFLPICIAFASKITGLTLEATAYALNTLLFAGTCATLVRIVQNQYPSAAWYAVLAALSLPAFNEQRNEIIREVGWWLFCLQALLAALRWQRQPDFRNGLAVQILLMIACLFRVEGAIFFGSLALWQLSKRQTWRQSSRHLATLLFLPILMGVTLLAALALSHVDIGSRIAGYASVANPMTSLTTFHEVAEQFGASVLNHYSADEADSILFFGLMGLVLKKFITNNGILLVPIALLFCTHRLRHHLCEWQPQAQFFFVYALALVAFVIHHLFISSRYVIFLNILTVPLIAIGLQQMFKSWPRWRHVILLCLLFTTLDNVVSLSPKKPQFRAAGQWLAERPEIAPSTYIDDSRTGYFAGSAFRSFRRNRLTSSEIEKAINQGRIDYLVIEDRRHNSAKKEWANSLGLTEATRFSNKLGDSIIIFRRKDPP